MNVVDMWTFRGGGRLGGRETGDRLATAWRPTPKTTNPKNAKSCQTTHSRKNLEKSLVKVEIDKVLDRI